MLASHSPDRLLEVVFVGHGTPQLALSTLRGVTSRNCDAIRDFNIICVNVIWISDG